MIKNNVAQVILKTDYSRRFPDPLNNLLEEPYNIEHLVLLVKAIDVPSGISVEPNPREQKIDVGIYKDIQASLEDKGDPTFHLKNKGITLFAQKVAVSDDKKVVTASLASDDGIADGGHTYRIILDSQSRNQCPDNQYVRFEIITGLPQISKADISGGLNTAVQVQRASLENLKGQFDWIKSLLNDMPYANQIAYVQNEAGVFDIRDIVAFMTIFNVEHPKLKGRVPKEAYTSKAACLNLYLEDKPSYEKLKPILKDILSLHDYIHLNLGKLYNMERRESGGKGMAHGMSGVFDSKTRGEFKFIFANEENRYKMFDGTFFPIFGAMRFLVEIKPGETQYSWKLGSFEEVKKLFNKIAADMLEITYSVGLRYGRKPNPVGKDESHWGYLYQIVKSAYLEQISK